MLAALGTSGSMFGTMVPFTDGTDFVTQRTQVLSTMDTMRSVSLTDNMITPGIAMAVISTEAALTEDAPFATCMTTTVLTVCA